ncbi:MAG: GNAT family N-acetyltransferase [Chloroflexota bacterium]|nr:MAG: GNAT family N-acetyltransferase [Chloroflexota bacterium]
MTSVEQTIIKTTRLRIRAARLADAELLYRLWTDARVMTNVGYPMGLKMSSREIEDGIREQDPATEYGRYLIAGLQANGRAIGECKMILPDEDGVSRTDVKLLPEFWGYKYGVEIKQALVDYLFKHTSCLAVEGTPNVNNIASIQMQEAVGAVRVGEDTYRFPESMAEFTAPVHNYIYQVLRSDWERRRKG